MMKFARSLSLLSAAALALGVGTTTADASSARAPAQQLLAKQLISPLSAAVAKDGSVYVTQNFGGSLVHVVEGEDPAVVYQSKEKNAEVGGVSLKGTTITFTVSGKNHVVKQIKNGGKQTTFADVGKYEASKNPDKKTTYGLQGATPECAAQWPVEEAGPPTYTGIVESHPYSTFTTKKGVYVGDAAGNDIVWAGNDGKIKTIAVLPPTPVTLTADAVAELALPACVTGLEYWLEPVPTDVELGPDGWLYVSSLPGGPESAALGANGRVYKIKPSTGKVKQVADGFIGTVDLAVANNGDIYVAELFGGSISKIKAGSKTAKPFVQAPLPGVVEWTKGALYATVNVLPAGTDEKPKFLGKLIRIDL